MHKHSRAEDTTAQMPLSSQRKQWLALRQEGQCKVTRELCGGGVTGLREAAKHSVEHWSQPRCKPEHMSLCG